MVSTIHFGDGLHRLSEELLGSRCSKIAAGRRGNTAGKRKGNRVERVCTVDCARVGRTSGIHQVVRRVQCERNIVGDPEDTVPTTDHHPARKAISEAKTWRKVVFIERNVIPSTWRDEKDISQHGR